MTAVMRENADMVHILIKKNANVFIKNKVVTIISLVPILLNLIKIA